MTSPIVLQVLQVCVLDHEVERVLHIEHHFHHGEGIHPERSELGLHRRLIEDRPHFGAEIAPDNAAHDRLDKFQIVAALQLDDGIDRAVAAASKGAPDFLDLLLGWWCRHRLVKN